MAKTNKKAIKTNKTAAEPAAPNKKNMEACQEPKSSKTKMPASAKLKENNTPQEMAAPQEKPANKKSSKKTPAISQTSSLAKRYGW